MADILKTIGAFMAGLGISLYFFPPPITQRTVEVPIVRKQEAIKKPIMVGVHSCTWDADREEFKCVMKEVEK